MVELAIVLVIIGFLIGGVLVAQSMISSARTNGLIRELSQWKIQSDLFKERFNAYPGDYAQANNFGGCNNTGNGCVGNGNGIIQPTGVPDQGRYEDIMFWHHLYLAGLSNNIPFGTTFAAGTPGYTPTIGLNAPSLAYHKLAGLKVVNIGASYLSTSAGLATAIDASTHYFWIGGNVPGYYQQAWLQPGIVKQTDAAALDSKIDDGIPNSGSVLGRNAVSNVGGEMKCIQGNTNSGWTGSKYSSADNDYFGGCVMLYKINDPSS